MLGCYLVSSAAANAESSPYLKAEALVLQGDALYEENELRRALHMYKQALQLCKSIPKQTTPVSRSSVTSSNMPSSPNSLNGSTINENEVKFKICLCYCKLNENRAALAEMDGIPSKARTLRMNLVLGKLLRISRHNRASIACYRDCIRQCPYVLEAISALAELGVSAKDILALFPQTPNRGRLPLDHSDTGRWLHHCWLEHDPAYSIHERWIYIHRSWILYCLIIHSDMLRPNAALLPMIIKKVQDFWSSTNCPWLNDLRLFLGDILCHGIGGLDNFSELLQRFPNNVHILLEIAKVEAIIGRNDEAIMNFEKVRSIDPYVMTYMDEYAMILKAKSEHSKLNKLVHDLLVIDPKRVEVSVTLSVLWERKDENKALAYAEKSVRMDDRHIAGHVMKGNLLLQLKRSDAAVTAFRAAQELRPDLRSYQGLVRSFLALSKTKEALYAAREAMKAMPQSAKALKLVGDVHASNPGGREKARKFYESALRLEPGFLGAALALAELHVVEGRNKDAVSLLERYLKDWADDSLHIKLAQVFAATDVLSEALSHYQAALRINPQNEAARKGLERLEKLMKGLDPDAPEEDEDNEVEDADGDQEEAELL